MKRVKQIVQYWCDDVIKGKYLGKGVVAVVLDTGIAPHPDFQNKVLAFRDFVNGQEVIMGRMCAESWLGMEIPLREYTGELLRSVI